MNAALAQRAYDWYLSLSEICRLELEKVLEDRVGTPAGVAKDWIEDHGGVRGFFKGLSVHRESEA